MAKALKIGSVIPGGESRARRGAIVRIAAACGLSLAASALAQPGSRGDIAAQPALTAPETALPTVRSDELPLGGVDRAGSRHAQAAESQPVLPAASTPRKVGVGQVAGALGFVIALILVVFKAIRQGARAKGGLIAAAGPGGRAPSGVLAVLGRYPLARGQTLLLLKLDRRVLLVAQTAGSRAGPALATLTEINDPEEVASIAAKCEEQSRGGVRFKAELQRYEDEHAAGEAGFVDAGPAEGTAVRSMRDRLAAWRGADPRGSAA